VGYKNPYPYGPAKTAQVGNKIKIADKKWLVENNITE
jgi:hypothetical protein